MESTSRIDRRRFIRRGAAVVGAGAVAAGVLGTESAGAATLYLVYAPSNPAPTRVYDSRSTEEGADPRNAAALNSLPKDLNFTIDRQERT